MTKEGEDVHYSWFANHTVERAMWMGFCTTVMMLFLFCLPSEAILGLSDKLLEVLSPEIWQKHIIDTVKSPWSWATWQNYFSVMFSISVKLVTVFSVT